MNKIEIHVTLNLDTGKTEVTGPLDMKPIVCKALASAIQAVIEHTPPVILPAGHNNGNGHSPEGTIKSN